MKSFRSDNVKYVYSVPHTFFYDKGVGDVASMLRYAGSDLSHVLIARYPQPYETLPLYR